MSAVSVRRATSADMTLVASIVNHYIEATTVNFRTAPQTPDDWHAEWLQHHGAFPWLVAARDEKVLGIAYANPWKARGAYARSAEVTIYVAHDEHQRGVGRLLYEALLTELDASGFHTQVAVIALPNGPSVALHERFGFRPVGTLREIGYKHGAWRDVGFWQRLSTFADSSAATSSE
jgi:phosphinothricin acetyltransferase